MQREERQYKNDERVRKAKGEDRREEGNRAKERKKKEQRREMRDKEFQILTNKSQLLKFCLPSWTKSYQYGPKIDKNIL